MGERWLGLRKGGRRRIPFRLCYSYGQREQMRDEAVLSGNGVQRCTPELTVEYRYALS